MTGGGGRALVCVPPAQHCIFCLSAFRCPLARVPQGTDAGYPRRFSPMRAFRQLPLPKACASQNGFHPAYALRCKMVWRNSFAYFAFKVRRRLAFPADALIIARGGGAVIKLLVYKFGTVHGAARLRFFPCFRAVSGSPAHGQARPDLL